MTRKMFWLLNNPILMNYNELKLNLGCGVTAPEGWINVDSSPNVLLSKIPGNRVIKNILFKSGFMSKEGLEANYTKNIIFCDLAKSFPQIKEGSCKVIYSSHFIEHISHNEAISLIKKCFMTLSSGGIFRAAVPDLYEEAKRYITRIESALTKDSLDWKASEEFICSLFSNNSRHSHKWMYDFFSLSKILSDCGFIDIEKKGFRQSKIEDIKLVENREDSLFVESKKP